VLTPFPRFPAIRRTPYVTGTTVLGLKYKDGVMIACDTLGASRDETRSRPRSVVKPARVGDGVSSNRVESNPK
jgi:20S proteasome alpha/beta subunit